ncbi:MAG: hypothetical protein R3Y29_07155 [bacterium]
MDNIEVKFKRDIEVPNDLILKFTNDMFSNLLNQMSVENKMKAFDYLGINIDPNTNTPQIQGDVFLKVLNYYIKAMENLFNLNPVIVENYREFQEILETKDLDFLNQNMSKILERLVSYFTDPLHTFFYVNNFGRDRDIMNHFSLLPPLIRYYVLSDLYTPVAIQGIKGEAIDLDLITNVSDRLVLAILKISDQDTTLDWIDKNIYILQGINLASPVPNLNMTLYNSCVNKVLALANNIKLQYNTFTEAYPHYKNNWKLDDSTPQRENFSKLVKFYYMSPLYAASELLNEMNEN